MTSRLSPVYSKQSQGKVERWHRELHKAIRVFKETILTNYRVTVGVGHVLLTWIVKHAAWIHNRYQLHADGRTSYERRWGNNYNKPICEFGETVNFQYSTRTSKTISNWSTGIWLGRCTNSDEHYVATKDDVYRTRPIRRLNR